MKPITRKEYYLAKAAGTYTGPTPPPVLREDYYLATLAGDYSRNCPAPVTRLEKYMSAAAGLTSYVPQPVTRIEKYWYAIAKGTGYVPQPVTREERFLYALVLNKPGPPKPEYVDKTAEGSMILLTDSAEAPLTALTLYGWSKQDGTPTPENPVPIVSAGDEGEINVTVQGGNLWDGNFKNGYFGSDGVIHSYGDNPTTFYLIVCPCLENTEYTVSYKTTLNRCFIGYSTENVEEGTKIQGFLDASGQSKITIATGGNAKYLCAYVYNKNIDVGQDFPNMIMINRGVTPLSYEPYKQPQTLTIPTPGGLPGIPVSSGGNYTDESGQQWVCDEVDFKRGKYVQRVCRYTLDGSNNISLNTIAGNPRFDIAGAPAAMANGVGYCDHFTVSAIPIAKNNIDKQISCYVNGGIYLRYDSCATVEALKEWITDNPTVYYYPLATPIETDLTAEELAAYKALHTYTPNTTVSNDAEAWMKVGYKAAL